MSPPAAPAVPVKTCGGCNKRIVDESQAFEIEVLEQFYHADCFCCEVCREPFSESLPYMPHEGKAYCEADYDLLFQEDMCAGCNNPVEGNPVQALGQLWHPHHLLCAGCSKPVRGNFFEHNDVVYCAHDYARLVAPRCKGCENPIQGETIVALDAAWHKGCFACGGCGRGFPDRSFYVWEGMPYCRMDYHRMNGSLCGKCREPIEGPCAEVQEINKRFHPNCWSCGVCRQPLSDVYYSYDGDVFCENDIRVVYKPNKTSKAVKRRTLLANLQ
ncbi:hypothetical protein BC829DRAFT_365505 [Chytridium lagenaria]|nr:hypothetical protein BC829DRAFT_365505 [Chytridium lagenaria]